VEDRSEEFADGGLIAPNGKPSNLTPEQYKLVRTPEFKAWFGDWENSPETASKVVDENGEPLVVYHYSPNQFTIFDKTKHPQLVDIVENKKHKPLGYDFSTKEGFYESKTRNKKYSVFLNAKNVFDFRKATEKEFDKITSLLEKIPYYSTHSFQLNLDIKNLKNGDWDLLERLTLEKYFSKNYDGLFMKENDWLNVKVYNSNQIKLADGTNTTFDANSPDIRFADGGLIAPNGKPSNLTPEQYKLVRTPEFKAWFGDWENDRQNSGKVSGITKEPSIWYHSTKSNFLNKKGENIFRNPPFYFALTNDVAEDIVKIQHQDKNGKIVTKPFFLRYKNPFDITKFDILSDNKLTSLIKKLTPYESEMQIKSFMLRLGLPNSSKNTWNLTESKEIQDWIKSKKYDSFFIYEDGHKNLAVFEATQIKLADGTNTTFDTNNPDIRFADGGELKEIKLPDLNMSYGALKKTLNYQGYDIEPMKQELQIGKVAKGMSVQQIAQHHNATVDEIQKQLEKGIQVEMEHTDNQDIARAIALDHVYESPVYYDKLETIEKEFKDGGVVVGKRHSEYDENGSGEKFLVESTGQVVELEGGEGVLCQESMSSDKKFSFEGKSMTGREIASYLNHKYGGVEFAKGGEVKKIDKIKADMPHVCGCKHQYYHGGEVPTAVVRNLKGGEAVVTVKSMESKDQYNFNGKPMTPRQIFSQINMASGGKKFEDGGVINLQSIKDDARLEFDIQLAKMMYYVTTLKQMI
jgi:hypothetical protein